MTNLLVLSILIFKTNIFNTHCRDNSGCWDQSASWNAQIRYVAPASTTNYTVVVESRKFYTKDWQIPYGYNNYSSGLMPLYDCTTNITNNIITCVTNGWFGAKFTELNTSPLFALPPYTNFNGNFTNFSSPRPTTNTVRFPIPPFDAQLFRLKRK
jgi:hypothetical protein